MRLDKFLKNSRIIKRRTVAKEACEQGRTVKLLSLGLNSRKGIQLKLHLEQVY